MYTPPVGECILLELLALVVGVAHRQAEVLEGSILLKEVGDATTRQSRRAVDDVAHVEPIDARSVTRKLLVADVDSEGAVKQPAREVGRRHD